MLQPKPRIFQLAFDLFLTEIVLKDNRNCIAKIDCFSTSPCAANKTGNGEGPASLPRISPREKREQDGSPWANMAPELLEKPNPRLVTCNVGVSSKSHNEAVVDPKFLGNLIW